METKQDPRLGPALHGDQGLLSAGISRAQRSPPTRLTSDAQGTRATTTCTTDLAALGTSATKRTIGRLAPDLAGALRAWLEAVDWSYGAGCVTPDALAALVDVVLEARPPTQEARRGALFGAINAEMERLDSAEASPFAADVILGGNSGNVPVLARQVCPRLNFLPDDAVRALLLMTDPRHLPASIFSECGGFSEIVVETLSLNDTALPTIEWRAGYPGLRGSINSNLGVEFVTAVSGPGGRCKLALDRPLPLSLFVAGRALWLERLNGLVRASLKRQIAGLWRRVREESHRPLVSLVSLRDIDDALVSSVHSSGGAGADKGPNTKAHMTTIPQAMLVVTMLRIESHIESVVVDALGQDESQDVLAAAKDSAFCDIALSKLVSASDDARTKATCMRGAVASTRQKAATARDVLVEGLARTKGLLLSRELGAIAATRSSGAKDNVLSLHDKFLSSVLFTAITYLDVLLDVAREGGAREGAAAMLRCWRDLPKFGFDDAGEQVTCEARGVSIPYVEGLC